jgi:hypothetical protein
VYSEKQVPMDTALTQTESQTAMNQEKPASTVESLPYCGHHYYNPQWIFQDEQTPALMYNDAVYFTVSEDGTHYYHQTFKGQFYPSIGGETVSDSLF